MYETASTRQFYSGRTETVRSCTEEAILWIQSMCQIPRDVSLHNIIRYISTDTVPILNKK
jgi:hypothetical protein